MGYMSTTKKSFASIVEDTATDQGLSLLEVSGRAGIPHTTLLTHLTQPNLFTLHQIACIALVIGVRVPDLVRAAL